MPLATGRRIPPWLLLVGFVAAALALHLRVLGCSFFSDDFQVLHRLGVRGDLGTSSFFRPLADWSLYLNYRVAGPRPWAFRVVNVALLGINAWLVVMLARNLFRGEARPHWPLPLLAGVLFLCYPFHNEPQLWIIGRGAAMATLVVLVALVFATGRAGAMTKCVVVGVCGALGALCYESALLLPLLLLAFAIALPKQPAWRLMAATAAAMVVVNLLLRAALTGHVANAYGSGFFDHGILGYVTMSAKVLGRLFLPPSDDSQTQVACFVALVLALVALVWLLFRTTRGNREDRARLVALLLAMAVSCTVAVLGGVSTRTSESDRFLYMPSAFLSLLLAFAITRLRTGTGQALVCGAVLGCSLFFMARNHAHWRRASHRIEGIIRATPEPPSNGRLLVWNLPEDHEGAFIFRHGYREALEFAGRDASRILISPEGPGAIWEHLRTDAGDTLHRNGNDRWFDAGAIASE